MQAVSFRECISISTLPTSGPPHSSLKWSQWRCVWLFQYSVLTPDKPRVLLGLNRLMGTFPITSMCSKPQDWMVCLEQQVIDMKGCLFRKNISNPVICIFYKTFSIQLILVMPRFFCYQFFLIGIPFKVPEMIIMRSSWKKSPLVMITYHPAQSLCIEDFEVILDLLLRWFVFKNTTKCSPEKWWWVWWWCLNVMGPESVKKTLWI